MTLVGAVAQHVKGLEESRVFGIRSLREYGLSLSAAITAIGATKVRLKIPAGTHAVAANATIPENVTLDPEPGGILAPAAGTTLTVNGPVICGPFQAFDKSAAGSSVSLPGSPRILPEWFGAVGSGLGPNDTAAIQAAVAAAAPGADIFLGRPNATYVLSEPISFAGKTGISLTAPATEHVKLNFIGTGNQAAVVSLVGARGITLRNVHIYAANAADPPKCGLTLGRSSVDSFGQHKMENVWVSGFYSHAAVYWIASEENRWGDGLIQVDGGAAKYTLYISQADDLTVGGFTASTMLSCWFHGVKLFRRTAYAGVGDDDCALIFIKARGATGDLSFRDCFAATTAGALVRFHVPDQNPDPDVGHGPFVFDGIRVENLGTLSNGQKFGVYVDGVTGAVLRGLDCRRITHGNLAAAGSYAVYGVDDVTLQDCAFHGTLPVKEDGSIATSSVDLIDGTVIGEGRHTFTVRDEANSSRLVNGRKQYVISAGWTWAGSAVNGAAESLDLALAAAAVGDEVRVVPSADISTTRLYHGYVAASGIVRVLMRNFAGAGYAGTDTFTIYLRKL
jgi:hypothetical protein